MSTAALLQNTAAKSPSLSGTNHAGLLLQRKCACGSPKSSLTGESEECKGKTRLQTKLSIGASNDPLEQEADRVADQVLAAPAHSAVSGATPSIQRFTGQSTGDEGTVPPSVDRVLASAGRPLEPALQQDMGQRFGHDFSNVRVHSGAAAEQSARDVNAHAYTMGHNLVFGAGQFAPGTHAGRRLIAHELMHVVQQNQAGNASNWQIARQPAQPKLPKDAPKEKKDCEKFPGGETECEIPDETTGIPSGKVKTKVDETNECTGPCVVKHEAVHVKQLKKFCPELKACYLDAEKGKRPAMDCWKLAIFTNKFECEAYKVSVTCMEKRLKDAKSCQSPKNKEYGTRKLASEKCFHDMNCGTSAATESEIKKKTPEGKSGLDRK